MWRPETIDTEKFLYISVADALESDIRNGVLKPGEKLPTHRELAEIIGINISTATRVYQEAERRGLITGTVGRGTYVATDYRTDSSILDLEKPLTSFVDFGPVYSLYNNEPDLSVLISKLGKNDSLNRYMRYSDPQGLPEHREAGVEWLKRFDIRTAAEDIVICAGVQHALTCCLTSLFKPGDSIAVDNLTYSGLKSLAKDLSIKLVPIRMDREGMVSEELESACHREQLKGIYVMPSIQNPTTIQMTSRRKKEIAEIVIRYNLIALEDDTFGFLLEEKLHPIRSEAPDNTVYISGISKAFFAGSRVSFVAAPRHLRIKITKAVLNTIWMTPSLNAAIVSACIREGWAEKIIAAKLKEAKQRFDIAKTLLSDFTFYGIPGCYFIWLLLPQHWTAHEFEADLRMSGINVFGAEKFVVGSVIPPAAARISLSAPGSKELMKSGLKEIISILNNGPMHINPVL